MNQHTASSQSETAETFVAMLSAIRTKFDREAASVREEARGRPLALAHSWLAEQESRVWQRVLGSAPKQRAFLQELCAFWALPVEVRTAHVPRLRRFDDLLHAFADALLRSACRRRDAREYERALIVLAVCDEGSDWRQTLTSLCLYWHVGLNLGLNSRTFFESVAASATPGAAELMREFAQRPKEGQRLDAFGHCNRKLEKLFEVDAG